MKNIEDAIAEYISVLADSLARTNYANDRHSYIKHLADAAIMFTTVHRGEPLAALKEQVAQERHNYGWGFLQGSEGEAAEAAFHKFATLIEGM